MLNIKKTLITELNKLADSYGICGIVDQTGNVYPLGSDTKVLSTVFELVSRPAVYATAKALGYEVTEPSVQNYYPDFTFHKGKEKKNKIAIDVKTTYRRGDSKFAYTLGGYTSFIRPDKETKNIVFPFNDYSEHWVIGFVYDRVIKKKAGANHIYKINQLDRIPQPIKNVEMFVQEKWRIASDQAGSGNTTNIGSVYATIADFRKGKGLFKSESEFLEYWRNYGRTKAERNFSNIDEFRRFRNR